MNTKSLGDSDLNIPLSLQSNYTWNARKCMSYVLRRCRIAQTVVVQCAGATLIVSVHLERRFSTWLTPTERWLAQHLRAREPTYMDIGIPADIAPLAINATNTRTLSLDQVYWTRQKRFVKKIDLFYMRMSCIQAINVLYDTTIYRCDFSKHEIIETCIRY